MDLTISAQLLDPTTPEFNTLLTGFVDGQGSLTAISQSARISIPELIEWSLHPAVQPLLERLRQVQLQRLRVTASMHSSDALARLLDLTRSPDASHESVRRAINSIFDLAASHAPDPTPPPARPALTRGNPRASPLPAPAAPDSVTPTPIARTPAAARDPSPAPIPLPPLRPASLPASPAALLLERAAQIPVLSTPAQPSRAPPR